MQTTAVKDINMHYFNNLRDALGDQHSAELPDGTKVHLHQGKAASISIDQERRTVDLSQDIDGTMMDGFELRMLDAAHDDERDFMVDRRPFPQNEADIAFLTHVADAIRTQKH